MGQNGWLKAFEQYRSTLCCYQIYEMGPKY